MQLTGFGTFGFRERSTCAGVKPGTTKKMAFPASKVPASKASKSFKNEIAQLPPDAALSRYPHSETL